MNRTEQNRISFFLLKQIFGETISQVIFFHIVSVYIAETANIALNGFICDNRPLFFQEKRENIA